MISIKTMWVHPELAKELLDRNPVNRHLRERHVKALARDMVNGRWKLNGETVKIGQDGDLKDGQHRLAAIIEADTPVQLTIAYGVDDDVQETIDTGARRTLGDTLKIRGESEVTALAAVIRHVTLNKMGELPHVGNAQLTTPTMLETLEAHPELREITHKARRWYQSSDIRVSTSMIGLAWWLFSRIDEDDAEEFFARLADGQGLVEGDPIYALRRIFFNAIADTKGKKAQGLAQYIILAYLIKAWNYYRDGTPVHYIRFKPGGAKRERFPEPR